MTFSLFGFWIPLLAVFHIYWALPSRRLKNLCLLAASYGFYLLVDYRVFPCLIASTLTDYIAGRFAAPGRKALLRRAALFCSLAVNLGLLFTFKYIPDLFHEEKAFVSLLKSVGLPLGISFYTFQTISYTLDCYGGRIKPSRDILSFALYVSFFPQLAAGPIERAGRLLPQFLNSGRRPDFQKFKEGFYLVLLGLFKKMYVAGALAHPLKRIYESANPPPSLVLLSGFFALFFLYLDFSSYSDLSRGIAKFFGIELMVNFKPFYFARNPREFWRKVHISLHLFIRDYLARPAVSALRAKGLERFIGPHIVFVFILAGLWHKASLNWLLSGAFSGLCYTGFYFIQKSGFPQRIPAGLAAGASVLFMFFFLTVNGLLYYSNDMETLFKMTGALSQFQGFGRETFDFLIYLAPFMIPLLVYEFFQHKKGTELFIMKAPFLVRSFWLAFASACILFFERNTENSFIYFGF